MVMLVCYRFLFYFCYNLYIIFIYVLKVVYIFFYFYFYFFNIIYTKDDRKKNLYLTELISIGMSHKHKV
jgi:hypothetical protein